MAGWRRVTASREEEYDGSEVGGLAVGRDLAGGRRTGSGRVDAVEEYATWTMAGWRRIIASREEGDQRSERVVAGCGRDESAGAGRRLKKGMRGILGLDVAHIRSASPDPTCHSQTELPSGDHMYRVWGLVNRTRPRFTRWGEIYPQ